MSDVRHDPKPDVASATVSAYANQFHRRMRLERAEELYDAVMADTRLTRAERNTLVWLAHQRFWADPRDAGNAYAEWLANQGPA